MIHNDTIQRGAGFYREIECFKDKNKTIPYDVTGRTILVWSTLMKEDGTHVADFSCSVLATNPLKIAWVMSRASSSTLDPSLQYLHCVDIEDTTDPEDIQNDRAAEGVIAVTQGQVKTS